MEAKEITILIPCVGPDIVRTLVQATYFMDERGVQANGLYFYLSQGESHGTCGPALPWSARPPPISLATSTSRQYKIDSSVVMDGHITLSNTFTLFLQRRTPEGSPIVLSECNPSWGSQN